MDITIQGLIKNSTNRIGAVHNSIYNLMKQIVERCHKRGVYVLFTQGMRTKEEQAKLYGQGRTGYFYNGKDYSQPSKPLVTNAKPGESIHNYGLALDFAIIKNGSEVVWNTTADFDKDGKADWLEVVEEAKKLGFKWGGDWTTFRDYSHLEWIGNLTYAQIYSGKQPVFPPIKTSINPADYYKSGVGNYKTLKNCNIYNGLVFSKAKVIEKLKKDTIIKAIEVVKSGNTHRLKIRVDNGVGYVSAKKTIVKKVPDPQYHTVEKGENLTVIAQKYDTTIENIMKLNNNIKNKDVIQIGQKIRVR